MDPVRRRWPLDRPLDVRRTLGLAAMWGGHPWLRSDRSGSWYAEWTEGGPATVLLRTEGGELVADAWGDGAAALLDRVPDIVGLDTAGVGGITPHHPFTTQAVARHAGIRQGRTGRVYEHLVSAALAQKVTGKNGKGALNRIAWRWGEPAPGPREDLRLLPEPRDLARRAYYEFHPLNVERRRADLVRRIAGRARALQRAAGLDPVAGRAHLEKLPGIGPWTSGVIMGGPLGDPDAYPVGDYHLPNWIAYNLAGEERGDDARMDALLAPYAGHRGLVARLVKGGGGASPPKRGPRMAVKDIREL